MDIDRKVKQGVLLLFLVVALALVGLSKYMSVPETPIITVPIVISITSTPYPGQAKDMRIGMEIPDGSTRYSSSPNMNFLGGYGFEDYSSTKYGEIARDWLLWSDGDWPNENTTNTVVFSMDNSSGNHVNGEYSQKITITNYVEPLRLGQYQSGRGFLANHTYKFGCWLKQEGLSYDVRLRIRFWCNQDRIDQHMDFSVGKDWHYYEMIFTLPYNCTPLDPYEGQSSSERIEVYSDGTLWMDNAQFYDAEDINEWGLSKSFIAETLKLRPATLRYGGLGCNSLQLDNIFGDRFALKQHSDWEGNVGGDVFDFNQFLKLCELTGANPEYVLSQHLIMNGSYILDLLEYIYGDNTTKYGAMRNAAGFDSWEGKFEKVYFELGNEVMVNANGPTWKPEEYADWASKIIALVKTSPYWNPYVNKIGVGLWYSDILSNVPFLTHEAANTGGSNMDFLLVARYYGESDFTNYYSRSEVSYNSGTITGSPEKRAVWYTRIMGESSNIDEYASYLKEMALKYYPNPIDIGIYEYGMTGVFKREPYNHEFSNMQTSLGAAVSMLDQSVNMRKQGLNPINAFYLQGFSWSWGFMDDYPHIKKRPIYYALEMYGTLQRGELIQSSFTSNTFNPFGDIADHKVMWDWLPKYDLKVHHYPVDVPTLAVYPFKYDDRYSILLINKNLKNTIQVILNFDYAPSNKALIASLTGDDPYLYNDGYPDDPLHINYNEVNNFTNNYQMTLAPHSAYIIVNYKEGSQVILDIDRDYIKYTDTSCALTTLIDPAGFNPRSPLKKLD